MMRAFVHHVGIFCFVFCLSSDLTKGQCIADGGADKFICVRITGVDTTQLGGAPTVTGGIPPYAYYWSTYYVPIPGLPFPYYFTETDFLDDPTSPNPSIVWAEGFTEPVVFYLTVTDSLGNYCEDTVVVRFSSYSYALGQFYTSIYLGDSVYLNGCDVVGGIPPLQYLWRPNHGLTDSTSLQFWAKPVSSVSYRVTVTDSIGCVGIGSNFWNITVIPLATTHLNSESKISVFNIPGRNEFLVKSSELNIEGLEIFNLLGESVLRTEYGNGSREEKINVSGLKTGVYLIKVLTPKGSVSMKVLKE